MNNLQLEFIFEFSKLALQLIIASFVISNYDAGKGGTNEKNHLEIFKTDNFLLINLKAP